MINVVIPAAGEATRLKPLTANCSKAMIRVHGKPTIEYIVESINKSGVEVKQIIIVDGKHDDIRDWVKKSKYDNIKCVKQGSLNGPRDAIKVGIESLESPTIPLVVWLGDAIILEENLPLGTDFLLTKEVEDHYAWCMWDGKKYYNKPKENIKQASALVGLYSFSIGYEAYNAFYNAKGYDISDALEIYEGHATFENIGTEKWYDIGDIASYHKTCATLLTFKAREFNSFEYHPDLNMITKVPTPNNSFATQTIIDEKNWYTSLSPIQSMLVPKVLKDDYSLTMSYESGILLSDLFAHEDISKSTIRYLIERVILTMWNHFHRKPTLEFTASFPGNAKKMWIDKTEQRLETDDPFYKNVAERCLKKARPVDAMHGDLHFGNILYNPYNDAFTLLDPRGSYGDHRGIGGDYLYDMCKLSHDLYHGYNELVTGHKYPTAVRECFSELVKEYFPDDYNEIIDGGALLIATCIKLHYDCKERQQRMRDYVNEYANLSS